MKIRNVGVVCVIALFALASACRESTPAQSTVGPASPGEASATLLRDRPSDTHEGDDYLYDIAREVPTYGGHQVDAKRDFVVSTTKAEDFDAARRAIRGRIANGRIFTKRSDATPRVYAIKADFSILQLGAWRDLIFDAQRDLGWTMLDLDEGRNRVSVGLPPKSDHSETSRFREAVAHLEIPWAAINIVITEATPAKARTAWPPATLGSSADTIVGGIRYAYQKPSGWFACTLGYPVSLSNGSVGFISASHCSATKWGNDYALMRQPNPSYIDTGYEMFDMSPGTCPTFWACNSYRFSDANLFLVSSRPVKVGYLAHANTRALNWSNDTTISTTTPLIQVVGETSSITQNSEMDAIGATTGWTYSTVEHTCVDLYSSNGLVRCSYYVHADIEEGDSGAPVFYYDQSTGTATATGIMFAKINPFGYPHLGVFSKMQYVRNEIQASGYTFSLLTNLSPPVFVPSATIVGVSNMQPNVSCYWYVASTIEYSSVSWAVNGVTVGSNWDLTHSAAASFLLEVSVTDGTSFATASKFVTVSGQASTCYLE